MSENTSSAGEKLGDSTHSIDLKGVKAVLLFPALGTPCLAQEGGGMTVVVAVYEPHFAELGKTAPGQLAEGQAIPVAIATKLHAHLTLLDWGNGVQPVISDFVTHKAHFDDIKRKCFLIAPESRDPKAKMTYRGWYLGRIEPDKERLISLFAEDGKQSPFGTLHSAAAGIYARNGYTRLFQLTFDKLAYRSPGLYELLWLYLDHDAMLKLESPEKFLEYLYGKPNDDLLTKMLEEGDRGIDPINGDRKSPVLQPNFKTQPRKGMKDGKPVEYNQYKLQSAGESFLGGDQDKKPPCALKDVDYGEGAAREEALTPEQVAYMSQDGNKLLSSRHPVYISKSELLTVGVVSDVHLSSRQTLYRFVAAQVIPGADVEDSPYLGRVCHDNLQSARELLTKTAAAGEALVVSGDLHDHTRNIDPSQCLKDIKTTGDLWYYLDYDGQASKKPRVYPRHLDGLMMVSLIMDCYNQQRKPIFFLSGNHEGYEHPYGNSPRLAGEEHGKANPGIPGDMNLTFYEAILLYGQNYHRYHTPTNFIPRNMNWLYAVLTPWKDCVAGYGTKQNLILLGWGEDEDIRYKSSFHLPRANTACSANQDTLLKTAAAAGQHGAVNILFSHFPVVSYDESVPFMQAGETAGDKTSLAGQQFAEIGKNEAITVGTAGKPQTLIGLLDGRNGIQYSVAGHSHRPGIYRLWQSGDNLAAQVLVKNNLQSDGDVEVDLTEFLDKNKFYGFGDQPALALVCSSSGPYGRQNLAGELRGWGREKPQGLLLDPLAKKARFIKSGAAKPRLAVLLDYLWCVEDLAPFDGVNIYRKDDRYYWRINPAWLTVFNNENPIAGVTIHAVNTTQANPIPIKSPLIQPTGSSTNGEERLSITNGDMDAFYNKLNKNNPTGISGYLLYFSVALQGTTVAPADRYDCASPWCFPVDELSLHSGDIYSTYQDRNFSRRGGIAGREIPNFEELGNIKLNGIQEYNMPRKK